MPTFLSDPSPTFYLVLVVTVVVTAAMWVRSRSRGSLIRAGIAAALLALVFLCDRLAESPREECVRKVDEMCAAASNPPNPDRFVSNVSDSFAMGSQTKAALRTVPAWGAVRQFGVRVAATGFERDEFKTISDTECEVFFLATAKADGRDASGAMQRYIRARFVRDPDGQYRLKSFKAYDPLGGGMNVEAPIPGFTSP